VQIHRESEMAKSVFYTGRRWLSLVLVVVMAGACASGGHSPPAKLELLGHPPAGGLSKIDVPIGVPVTVETYNICSVKAPVSVTGVQLDNPVGIDVVGWASRRNPPSPGVENPPARYGKATDAIGFSSGPIQWLCSNPNYAATFVLTVKTSAPDGTFFRYRINYRGGSLEVPYGLALCEKTCPPGFGDPGAGS
jgi:hypothetical protein